LNNRLSGFSWSLPPREKFFLNIVSREGAVNGGGREMKEEAGIGRRPGTNLEVMEGSGSRRRLVRVRRPAPPVIMLTGRGLGSLKQLSRWHGEHKDWGIMDELR
jgi:hypothetical protein